MTARNILATSALAVVATMAPSTAWGQTLAASPAALQFVHQRTTQAGTIPPTQNVNITGPAGVTLTFTTQTNKGGNNWLLLIPTGNTAPMQLGVIVNPNVTPALTPDTYTGTITITPSTGSAITVTVTFIVSDTPLIQSSTPVLTFQYSRNGSLPPAQKLGIGATAGGVNFTLPVATSSGGDWLRVNPNNGTAGTIVAPNLVDVSVTNLSTLAVGTYGGIITLSAASAQNTGVQVAVVLQVLEEARLTTSLSAVAFEFQTGAAAPFDRGLFVSSTGASVSFTAETIHDAGQSWLSVVSGNAALATPAILSLRVNPANLVAGTYNAKLRLTSSGVTNSPLEIPVSLRITGDSLLTATPSEGLRFTHQTGGTPPARQPIVISGTGAAQVVNVEVVTASGGNWLSATPGRASTPFTISVGADPGTLAAGSYTGTVRVTGTFANSPREIPVTFVVAGVPAPRVSDNILTYYVQQGNAVPNRTLSVTSTGANFALAVSATSGGNWLTVTSSGANTPAEITVGVNGAALPPGVHTGTVNIGPADNSSPVVQIPVRVLVGTIPGFVTTQSALIFNHTVGRPLPDNQTLRLNSSSTNFNYTLQVATADQPWLVISRTSGTTGSNDPVVGVNPGSLPGGIYTGVIIVQGSVPNNPTIIPVLLNVSAQAQDFVVNPVTLTFSQNAGATSPGPQSVAIRLNPEGRVAFTAAAATINGGNWLTVTPGEGLAPQEVQVSVNGANLAAGIYTGTITITPLNAPNLRATTIPVTFTVVRLLPNLVLSRESVTFNFTPGGSAPQAERVQVTSSGDAIAFNVATQPSGSWLSASAQAGSPDVVITVNPATLSPGTYTGTVVITSQNAANSPRLIAVTLTVGQQVLPTVVRFVHAATFQPISAAPGLIVTITGTNLGPTQGVGLALDNQGLVDTTRSGVRVLFDNTPAPLLFVSERQINCVVPYAVAGRRTTRLQVENNRALSTPLELNVVDTAPGIFQLQGSQAAVINQTGTINGAAAPAAKGSVITIYATGEGATTPAGVDGFVPRTLQQLRRPLAPVRVRIGGVEAEIAYAGSAPEAVSGLLQVNAFVPESVASGAQVPIDLIIGGITSPGGTTIAVQ